MTQHYVNVCGFRPFCIFVGFQSQLANILAVQSLAKEFLEDKVTTYFNLLTLKFKGHSLDFSFCSLPWSLWHTNWKVDQNKFYLFEKKININLHRHTGLNKSISGSLVANNILWFLHRSNLSPPFSSQDHISDVFKDFDSNLVCITNIALTSATDWTSLNYISARSPEDGAATPLHCALAPSLANTTGALLMRLQKEEIDAFASDQVMEMVVIFRSKSCQSCSWKLILVHYWMHSLRLI